LKVFDGKKDIYDAVKRATVAIIVEQPKRFPKRPFTIAGSGFCIHPEGIVVTCEHVFKTFVDPVKYKELMEAVAKSEVHQVTNFEQGPHPHVMFYGGIYGSQMIMHPIPVSGAVTKTNFDLAVFKLPPHTAYPAGYPTLEIADYSKLHEMMEVATCGFPLGEALHDQFGTVTSSFTQGRISSISPVAGVPIEHLKGFQLDMTATNGNSGGPVFSLETGHVFGVLASAALHPVTQTIVQGLIKAEPVYPALENDLVERMLKGDFMPP
jgi:S1-C subfamily serine protease